MTHEFDPYSLRFSCFSKPWASSPTLPYAYGRQSISCNINKRSISCCSRLLVFMKCTKASPMALSSTAKEAKHYSGFPEFLNLALSLYLWISRVNKSGQKAVPLSPGSDLPVSRPVR